MGALWPRINVSLQSVAQILLVIGLGAWLSARRNLDRSAIASVSIVNWHVLIPALMFSSIVGAVTPSGLLLLWPLLVLSLVHIVMGVVPALLLGWAARLPKDMCFFTVMAASLPNCGNLPWLFMPTIIRYYTPADQVAAQIQYSTGLTSVYTIMVVLVTLTVPFLFKKPPDTLVLPRSSSLIMPRSGSTVSLADTQESEEGADANTHQHPHQHQQQHHQQQQLQQGHKDALIHPSSQQQQQQLAAEHQRGSTPGATAWVVPAAADMKVPGAPGPLVPAAAVADISDPADITPDIIPAAAEEAAGIDRFPALDGLQQAGAVHTLDQQQQLGQLPRHWREHHHQQQQQQQQRQQQQRPDDFTEHPFAHQPSVGGIDHGFDSFASHRSSSFLLTQSRQLLGSFSRSFSRGVNRGLRRSASFVQLVWSYPTGWQPQRGRQQRGQGGRQENAAGGTNTPPWLHKLASAWSALLAHPVVNLPVGATVVGLICAAVGPVRQLLVNELAPLHWLWLGLGWVGAAAAPIATMQIGAELMQTAPVSDSMHVPKRVQWTANAIAIFVKLIVVPLVNLALLRLAGLSRLVPATDSVYQLLMLVEATVPAAVTLLVTCSRIYPDIRPLSSMLFWQYVASLFTLPAFLVWYLYMLEL